MSVIENNENVQSVDKGKVMNLTKADQKIKIDTIDKPKRLIPEGNLLKMKVQKQKNLMAKEVLCLRR